MDLFSASNSKEQQPLAIRMRPKTLEDFVGQEEILGEGSLLRRAISADRLQSLILYGPPGTGKTSLGEIIAKRTEASFVKMNAVSVGVKEVREVLKKAQELKKFHKKRTILFLDEVHRFNRSQQDVLLPAVEDGLIILIGATTQNPYHELNPPLLSRSRIFQLKPLKYEDLHRVILRALTSKEGLKELQVDLEDEARDHLIQMASGDARSLLNALELSVLTTEPDGDGVIRIHLKIAEESIQKRALSYDKDGDHHYDIVSAFIKSMRGSDPHATLYYLARMIYAGEDPRFIARRLLVHAAEDVGNATPHALILASAAATAVEYVGLPEARIPLAQAALFIATAKKSNSAVIGIDRALKIVEEGPHGEVLPHLRDSSYFGAKDLGHGAAYQYPHDYPGHYVKQEYLPSSLKGLSLYSPSDEGYEKTIKEYLASLDDSSRGKKS